MGVDTGIEFVGRVRSGERVRCALVVGCGGSGKSMLADQVSAQLGISEIASTIIPGDLAPSFDSLGDTSVVILDAADQSSADFLNALRADALDNQAQRSVLLLARNSTATPELAELAALADRDGMVGSLGLMPLADINSRIPTGGSTTATGELVAELTGAIPLHVDRLCSGWDAAGWPNVLDVQSLPLPDRFVDTVRVQMARLCTADRHQLAERAMASLAGVEPADVRRAKGLIEAGLAITDGAVPRAIALAVRESLTQDEADVAASTIGVALLQTDPELAVDLLDGSTAPASWTAVALAASGQIDRANKELDRVLGAGETPDGAALAAAAHLAAIDARWGEAARASAQIETHPYWSAAKTDAIKQLYQTLDLAQGPIDVVDESPEPTASFLAGAVAAMALTMDESLDGPALGEQLRDLVRQSASQQPMLDVAITGSELAALAALVSGDFEVAQTLMARSPEAADRTSMNAALGDWIEMRAGANPMTSPAADTGQPTDLFLSNVLSLATQVMSTRRTGDIPAQAEVLQSIVELGSMLSVDLVTFDALCELHLGAQRLDARREAREISNGLDEFVQRIGSPVLWEVRLLWNKLEAAIAAGDAVAVGQVGAAIADLPGGADAAPALISAAQQWVAIFSGASENDKLRTTLDDLEGAGYLWEAAALAGQAAIRSEDSGFAKELLQRGRDFRQATPQTKPTSPAGLSEREIEIGLLVLAGHSYKEIGATCFISPKTVEHHIAHIRQKLSTVGGSRAEFRAALESDLRPTPQ